MNRDKLASTLQIVRLVRRLDDRKALGNFRGEDIDVINGNGYLGREAIVRFVGTPDYNNQKAYFITDDVPKGFSPLENDRYVLLGPQRFSVPTIPGKRYDSVSKFRKTYDPFTVSFGFIDDEYHFKPVIYRLHGRDCEKFETSISEYLKMDRISIRDPNVIICQNEDLMGVAHGEIVRTGRMPVPMKPKKN